MRKENRGTKVWRTVKNKKRLILERRLGKGDKKVGAGKKTEECIEKENMIRSLITLQKIWRVKKCAKKTVKFGIAMKLTKV